jgi:hypothetical protein
MMPSCVVRNDNLIQEKSETGLSFFRDLEYDLRANSAGIGDC